MNLYHWARATCIAEYASGDIIIMAPSVDEARQLATAHVDEFLKYHRSWWWSHDVENQVDEEYVDDYQEFKRKLEEDLVAEPDAIDPAVVFIRGSE